MTKQPNKLVKARHILREHGARGLAQHTRGFVRTRLGMTPESTRRRRAAALPPAPNGFTFPPHLLGSVDPEDVLAADWTDSSAPAVISEGRTGPYTVNWVIPPASPGSGGHQNIFRFVSHLESQGHTCRIYIYDPWGVRSIGAHESIIRDNFVDMRAPILAWGDGFHSADAIFATSWQTAYPVFNDASGARRFYFVQDYEPHFYPVGSESVLASNTYRFGFHGITAGGWLSSKLASEYGMRCDHYDFGADADRYYVTGDEPRSSILFYARPPTPRRAWELGVLTLTVFAKMRPDVAIHMAGWPLRGFRAGFDFVDHGVLDLDDLNGLYNQMSAALVLSLTNCSLLPLELLAAGCVPVMNDADNNRMVTDVETIRYCPPSPHALARALAETCDLATPASARRAQESVSALDWATSCQRFEAVLTGALRA